MGSFTDKLSRSQKKKHEILMQASLSSRVAAPSFAGCVWVGVHTMMGARVWGAWRLVGLAGWRGIGLACRGSVVSQERSNGPSQRMRGAHARSAHDPSPSNLYTLLARAPRLVPPERAARRNNSTLTPPSSPKHETPQARPPRPPAPRRGRPGEKQEGSVRLHPPSHPQARAFGGCAARGVERERRTSLKGGTRTRPLPSRPHFDWPAATLRPHPHPPLPHLSHSLLQPCASKEDAIKSLQGMKSGVAAALSSHEEELKRSAF